MNVKCSDGPSVGGYGVGETRRCAVIRAWRASERDSDDTALKLACRLGEKKIARLLLEHGAETPR
ncbi:hypothetical protein B0H14DRAFT_3506673 [Mycena olivaceomarginata]|nr:hypothetical protein B0H14DRAFT_3506673 [Mycena olivaceomarginata]